MDAPSAGGERIIEPVPRNDGEQTSLISSLQLGGVDATMRITGAVDTPGIRRPGRAGSAANDPCR